LLPVYDYYILIICLNRLWEPGYRERYYREKFGVELSDITFRTE
jgi:hypothetical protein